MSNMFDGIKQNSHFHHLGVYCSSIHGRISRLIKKFKLPFKNVNIRETFVYQCLKEGLYMMILGLLMAIVSLGIDFTTSQCLKGRKLLFARFNTLPVSQYFAWTGFIVGSFILSATIAHFIGPSSIGSGVPEIKTVLQGNSMDEFFTVPTLIAKCLGLILATGTGMPAGREGPYIHMACILAVILYRWFYGSSTKLYSSNREFLVIACAVGVSCCFSSPIGGVLFTIEVTSTYFAVKNYWRGFFCAITGALILKLLDNLFHGEEIVTTFYKTKFSYNFFLYPQEIVLFIGLGVLCGIIGSLFIVLYRSFISFLKSDHTLCRFFAKRWWLYTLIIAMIVASLSFPLGLGRFYNSQMSQAQYIRFLFYNNSPTNETFLSYLEFAKFAPHLVQKHTLKPYSETNGGIMVFILVQIISTLLIVSAPLPTGLFIPIFALGAAIGKLYGNMVGKFFYQTLEHQYPDVAIISGIYSMIGAASLSGSVTRSISTSVIVFEITGQITHLLPTVIAVLVANAVAHSFVPSIYNVAIMIKKLPYLPDISIHYKKLRNLTAFDIMKTAKGLPIIYPEMSYAELEIQLNHQTLLTEIAVIRSSVDFTFVAPIQRDIIQAFLNEELDKEKWTRTFKRHHSLQSDIEFTLQILPNSIDKIHYENWKRQKHAEKINFEALIKCNKNIAIQISPNVSFQQIHELFTILNVEYLYVTGNGKLLGIISFTNFIGLFDKKCSN